jgi:hypothetical protein
MIRKLNIDLFWPKISHAKSDDRLILDIESYGGTGWIDVESDLYVEVSHANWTGVTSS